MNRKSPPPIGGMRPRGWLVRRLAGTHNPSRRRKRLELSRDRICKGTILRMSALCRDCLADVADGRAQCPLCASRRILAHPELDTLTIAHLDCDAFYAAVEERDNPALKGQPLIVGGGKRGVVLTASYAARKFGAKSAMPMFQALRLCPQAIVIKPDMAKYA